MRHLCSNRHLNRSPEFFKHDAQNIGIDVDRKDGALYIGIRCQDKDTEALAANYRDRI